VAYVAHRIEGHPLISFLGNEQVAVCLICEFGKQRTIIAEGLPDKGNGLLPRYEEIPDAWWAAATISLLELCPVPVERAIVDHSNSELRWTAILPAGETWRYGRVRLRVENLDSVVAAAIADHDIPTSAPATDDPDTFFRNYTIVKRETAIKDCVQKTGETWRECQAAYNRLPAERKNPRARPTKKPKNVSN
jgi:hypothetical protein